jgi:hypothetical protein
MRSRREPIASMHVEMFACYTHRMQKAAPEIVSVAQLQQLDGRLSMHPSDESARTAAAQPRDRPDTAIRGSAPAVSPNCH